MHFQAVSVARGDILWSYSKGIRRRTPVGRTKAGDVHITSKTGEARLCSYCWMSIFLRPAGGDPGLDHLQKYFLDSLCFLESTWPFWSPWKNFHETNVWFKQRKTRRKVVPSLSPYGAARAARSADWLKIDGRENPVRISTLKTGRYAVRFAALSSSHLHF